MAYSAHCHRYSLGKNQRYNAPSFLINGCRKSPKQHSRNQRWVSIFVSIALTLLIVEISTPQLAEGTTLQKPAPNLYNPLSISSSIPSSTDQLSGITALGGGASTHGALNANQVSMASNSPKPGSIPGYWLAASDGGIFSFGGVPFFGSMGGRPLNAPIVGMAATPDGGGYTLVGSDGGTFAFGSAPFYGSLGGIPLSRPIVSMAISPTGTGYWFTDNNGAVSAFGNVGNYGSAPQVIAAPVVGIAEGPGNGTYADPATIYPPGSYGYDISAWQCTNLPSGPHAIGVVEVEGGSNAWPNTCLTQEAAWAGTGLSLYTFLTYGTSSSGPPACNGDPACNFGFDTAVNAFKTARAANINASVTWWLDVEGSIGGTGNWSTNLSENANMVAGALAGIRSMGINTVGIYASPMIWNQIVGNYQPSVPYWMAWYQSPASGPSNCANAGTWTNSYALPTGPIEITQYTDNAQGFDGDYAC